MCRYLEDKKGETEENKRTKENRDEFSKLSAIVVYREGTQRMCSEVDHSKYSSTMLSIVIIWYDYSDQHLRWQSIKCLQVKHQGCKFYCIKKVRYNLQVEDQTWCCRLQWKTIYRQKRHYLMADFLLLPLNNWLKLIAYCVEVIRSMGKEFTPVPCIILIFTHLYTMYCLYLIHIRWVKLNRI